MKKLTNKLQNIILLGLVHFVCLTVILPTFIIMSIMGAMKSVFNLVCTARPEYGVGILDIGRSIYYGSCICVVAPKSSGPGLFEELQTSSKYNFWAWDIFHIIKAYARPSKRLATSKLNAQLRAVLFVITGLCEYGMQQFGVHYRRTEDRFLLKIDHLYTKYDGLKDKLLPFVAIFIAPILGATILLNFFLGVISVPENSTGTGCHEFDIVGSSEGLAQIQNTLYDQQPLLLVSTALVLLVALIGAAVFLRRKKW